MGRPERRPLELIFLESPKIGFGPKSRRQGMFLDDFLFVGPQIASGVRFRVQKPQIRPDSIFF